jgi:hypothetical protein
VVGEAERSVNKPKTQRARLVALEVENWNLKHPVGTAVTLRKDSGDVVDTQTRGAAEVSASGHAVIWLEGVSGYYLLDRVSPR